LFSHRVQLISERMPLTGSYHDTPNRRACNDASRNCRPIYGAGIPTTCFGYGISILGLVFLALGLGALASLLNNTDEFSWLHILAIIAGCFGVYCLWHGANLSLNG